MLSDKKLAVGNDACDQAIKKSSFGVGLADSGVIISVGGETVVMDADEAESAASDLFWLARIRRKIEAGWNPTDEDLRAEISSRMKE